MLINQTDTSQASIVTLSLVLAWVKSAPLSDVQKRDFKSAIKTACRWFGKRPDEVPANPVVLRRMFKMVSRGGAGVSRKRLANVRSGVGQALKLMGIAPTPLHKFPLSPGWQQQLCVLQDKYDLILMTRFGKFCSLLKVEPGAVSDTIADQLRSSFENELRVACPKQAHRDTIALWNRLACNPELPWPRQHLSVPTYSRTYALGWEEFHPDLRPDVENYLARRITVDPFDLSAPISALKASSAATYRQCFRLFATCLVHTGTAPHKVRVLPDLIELEAVERGLRYLALERKVPRMAGEIAKLLASTARNLGKGRDAGKIAAIGKRLRGKRSGLGRTVRERLKPLKHEGTLAKLFLFPTSLTRTLVRNSETSISDARLFQYALALRLLTVCPLRIGSLCSIRLDRHLNWSGGQMCGDLILEFDEGELKNGEPASFPVSRDVARLIRVYCERFRPLLDPGGSPFLFCGRYPNRPRSRNCFSSQLTQLVFDELGLHVNPHLYRHIVHLVVLRRFPAAYAMVARILGHRGISTTIQNYSYLDGEISMQAYQRLVGDVTLGTPHDHGVDPAVVASALNREDFARVRR